jgi:hypothetical protein
MRESPMLDTLNQVFLRLLAFSSEQTRSRAIKFLNVLKLFIAKLTKWDNLEVNRKMGHPSEPRLTRPASQSIRRSDYQTTICFKGKDN